MTEGIISAKGRTVDPSAPQNLLQIDAAINPGNSGSLWSTPTATSSA